MQIIKRSQTDSREFLNFLTAVSVLHLEVCISNDLFLEFGSASFFEKKAFKMLSNGRIIRCHNKNKKTECSKLKRFAKHLLHNDHMQAKPVFFTF